MFIWLDLKFISNRTRLGFTWFSHCTNIVICYLLWNSNSTLYNLEKQFGKTIYRLKKRIEETINDMCWHFRVLAQRASIWWCLAWQCKISPGTLTEQQLQNALNGNLSITDTDFDVNTLKDLLEFAKKQNSSVGFCCKKFQWIEKLCKQLIF